MVVYISSSDVDALISLIIIMKILIDDSRAVRKALKNFVLLIMALSVLKIYYIL